MSRKVRRLIPPVAAFSPAILHFPDFKRMGLLGVKPLLCVLLFIIAACSSRSSTMPVPARTQTPITPADVRARIYLIADDSMRGRQAGFTGNLMMTNYLAAEAARLRLEPAGENGTYFQTVPMVRRSVDCALSHRRRDCDYQSQLHHTGECKLVARCHCGPH